MDHNTYTLTKALIILIITNKNTQEKSKYGPFQTHVYSSLKAAEEEDAATVGPTTPGQRTYIVHYKLQGSQPPGSFRLKS